MIQNESAFSTTRNLKKSFKECYAVIKNEIVGELFNEFKKLQNDEERIYFVSQILPNEKLPPIEDNQNGKNERAAKELKFLGNKAFGKGHYDEALNYYNESILKMPQNTGTTDFALTIANRSAVFYYLKHYNLAINDIDVALHLNYPTELKFKIFERKAKCLLALKKYKEAFSEFQKTINALKNSKLSTEKKIKMQKDIELMLKMTNKFIEAQPNALLAIDSALSMTELEFYEPKLSSPQNKNYDAVCNKIEIKENTAVGRYAEAASNISAGDILLIENAYCSVLLGEYFKTHCQHCFKRTLAPYPCKTCSEVIFCSMNCMEIATYHAYECSILKTLLESGVSVTVLMALRILTQKNVKYFLELKTNSKNIERKRQHSCDYMKIYDLVRHESLRLTEDFLERSAMAVFLLQCLMKANYFGCKSKENTKDLSYEEKVIGGLLLRHLQILQFNAHEISELELEKEKNLDESKSLFIGGGLYPTLALFNHSCDPGIVRYFDGTRVIVRAVKPIQKGEMVAENYGPIYSQMKKKTRQEKLLNQYWFKCECTPCQELWPTFDKMDKQILRFRCNAKYECNSEIRFCRNILPVPITTEDFIIKCFICGRNKNFLQNLKILQGTDLLYKEALEYTKKGHYLKALNTYLEILTKLHNILAPPFQDYLHCQQSIRKCILVLGNKYIKTVSKF